MLELLSENEQRALMELLIYLAKSDGNVDDIERELLTQYADLVHVNPRELSGDYTPEQLVPQFSSACSKVAVLQELFRLSHINGSFAITEQSTILDVGAMMGVPMSLLRKIEQWVLEGMQWNLRGEELVQEAEAVIH